MVLGVMNRMLVDGPRIAFIVLVVIPMVVSVSFLAYTAVVEAYCHVRARRQRRSHAAREN